MNENTNSLRDLSISLTYNTVARISPNLEDCEDYIIPVSGQITGQIWNEDDSLSEKEILLGQIKLFLIRVGNALNDEANLFGAFDTHQSTMEAGCAIYQPNFDQFNDSVTTLFPDASEYDDLMIIDSIEISPLARGQKLGLAVIIRAIKDWSSGCSLVLIKPFPLQFMPKSSTETDPLDFNQFPKDKKVSLHQLRNYYSQLGFRRIDDSEFYGLCTSSRWSALEGLEFPDLFSIKAE